MKRDTPPVRPAFRKKVFLLGIAAITLVGVAVSIAERSMDLPALPAYLGGVVPFLFIAGSMALLYRIFPGRPLSPPGSRRRSGSSTDGSAVSCPTPAAATIR